MSTVPDNFTYYSNSTELPKSDENSFVAIIPKEISSKRELHNALDTALNFPEYYGSNWDALDECLRDFEWISQQSVILIHQDLPTLDQLSMTIYLDILLYAIAKWYESEKHKFKVMFPEDYRKQIESTIRKIK